MTELTLSLLHSYLVNRVPVMEPAWKQQILSQQFPSGSKRGGLGFGGHAKIEIQGRSQFCNINLFGLDPAVPRLELKQAETINDFTVLDLWSGKAVGAGRFFDGLSWYGSKLGDGRRVTDIIQAHMGREAVTVLGKTRCVGFDQNTACQYCSLKGGLDNPFRTGADIIEALEIALGLNWKPASLALTTTWIDPNNPLDLMADDISQINGRFPSLPIAFEAQPLTGKDYLLLKEAGVSTIMVPMDSVSGAEVFTPIKAGVIGSYMDALRSAREVFPVPGSVTSPLIVGLDPITTTLGLIGALVKMGVKPEPVPLRIFDGRIQERTVTGNLEMAKELTRVLWSTAWGHTRIAAGCSQCGGCSGV